MTIERLVRTIGGRTGRRAAATFRTLVSPFIDIRLAASLALPSAGLGNSGISYEAEAVDDDLS
jgi:hypothetical protein